MLLLAVVALAVPGWLATGTRTPARSLPRPPLPAKRIALTFDDVPRGPGAFYAPAQRTRMLIAGLRDAGVNQAGFFVNPGRINSATGNAASVDAYAAAGHVIGDHGFSHRDLSAMPVQAFLADVDRAELWLKGRPGYRPWFRFPGLNQGGHDGAKRQAALDGLKARGLLVADVTANGADWNMERLTIAARDAGRAMDLDALGRLYVETMVQAADVSNAVMQRAIGRSPAHVLLLHETDLAARYIGPLVAALRKDGWQIVTADTAYADPIYHIAPDVPYANGTLTEAIGWEKGLKGPLGYDRADPRVGDRLFAERVLRPAAR